MSLWKAIFSNSMMNGKEKNRALLGLIDIVEWL